MLSSFLDVMLTQSKTTSPQKLFRSDCITLYLYVFSGGDGEKCFKAGDVRVNEHIGKYSFQFSIVG